MRVALVLHGQPRNFLRGHANMNAFMSHQQGVILDVFYHCWVLQDGEMFSPSPFRDIPKADLVSHGDTPAKLEDLYHPVACEYEHPPAAFNLTLPPLPGAGNLYNTASPLYSRTKAMKLVADFIQHTNTRYDAVISTRFDVPPCPSIRLHEIDLTKVYMSDIHRPRNIFSDVFIVIPTDVYLRWFGIYDNFERIVTSPHVHYRMRSIGETVAINGEEMMTSSYLFHYETIENVVFSPLIVGRMT